MLFAPLIRKILFRFIRAGEKQLLSPGNSKTRELPWSPGGENTIQDMLDTVGMPWTMPTEDIIARFGLSRHPAFDWEQSPIKPCPLGLDGLIYPLSPEPAAFSNRNQVPLSFSGQLWVRDSPFSNIEHAHRQLAKLLGPAPVRKIANTYAAQWRAGPARISATVWPEWYQDRSTDIPAHKRDKRLRTACTIRIDTGYRRPMSHEEREWLESFSPWARVQRVGAVATLDALWASAPGTGAQHYICLPPTDQDNFLGQIGFSEDGRAMIISTSQLYIVPLAQITGLSLYKMLPAKGPGGAGLVLNCRYPGMLDERDCEIGLSESLSDTDALDSLASRLCERLGCELTAPEPQYDC